MKNAAALHSERMLRKVSPDTLRIRQKRTARVAAEKASRLYGCRMDSVFDSKNHQAHVVSARRYVIHELRGLQWTQSAIANALGMDRCTVLYALGKPVPNRPVSEDFGPIPCPDESGIWAI